MDFSSSEQFTVPTESEAMVEFAVRLIRNAYKQKVQQMQSEAGNLRLTIKDREKSINDLENTITQLQQELQNEKQKNATLQEEKNRVVNENVTLTQANQKLKRDINKLRSFKKAIMETFKDEEDGDGMRGQAYDFMANASYMDTSPLHNSPQRIATSPVHATLNRSDLGEEQKLQASIDRSRMYLTPSHGQSSAPGNTTTGTFYETPQRSKHSEIPSSTLVPGKEFFKSCRERLSYEQFNSFLSNIRRLNSHIQSREETLAVSKDIFGPDNEDLYVGFEALINRNMSASTASSAMA
eukprot:GCRY01002890.1.p1 GENE.GCRY01002890.1~~GCRY01002890.1.p1  ORF type:complete len:296 (-),score=43.41 GCRY01002890.1:379-1266(-)